MSNIAYLIALQSVDGLGPIRLRLLLEYFKDPQLVWQTPAKDLREFRIPIPILKRLETAQKTVDPNAELEKITKKGLKVISIFDPEYPESLRQIYNPPVVIYYAGQFPPLIKSIAIVGTRKISGYGRMVTQKLTSELVEQGFVIVSGLAKGVDTVAHQTTVEMQGQTIAVLGGGMNQIFPHENTRLAHQIAESRGVVLSEYHPDAPSLPGNFPARNRIIAGLSQAVVVTEATEDSGSIITAHLGLDQGKEVFAVPGPINSSLSAGPLELIKQGAKLVTSSQDIVQELGFQSCSNSAHLSEDHLEQLEKTILQELSVEKKHVDELIRSLGLPSAKVSSSLLKLEISGFISHLGNGVYTKNL